MLLLWRKLIYVFDHLPDSLGFFPHFAAALKSLPSLPDTRFHNVHTEILQELGWDLLFSIIPLLAFDENGVQQSPQLISPAQWNIVEDLIRDSPLSKSYRGALISSVLTRNQSAGQTL